MQTIQKLTADILRPPAPTPGSPTSDWRPALDEWHPTLTKAADACALFVSEIAAGRPPRWLTLAGECGCGKTMLAEQTYRHAAAAHWDRSTKDHPQAVGLYSDSTRRPNFRGIDEARFARLYLDDKQWDLPEYIAHEWLVLYDDLGSKRDGKEVLADAILRLANQRLGKWTLWTTNLNLDEIKARIDARVASRLIRDDNRLVTITAGDYAKKPKK